MNERVGRIDPEATAGRTREIFDAVISPGAAGLRFAAALTRDPQGIDDRRDAALQERFDEGEIVEIAAAAGLFNCFNQFNDALRVPPTR